MKKFHDINIFVMIVLVASFTLGVLLAIDESKAHNGGLSQTDYCHKDNKAGERHWHFTGTVERGGVCVDGVQVGNCQVVKVAYVKCRKDRHCSWQKEAKAARAYIDCFEKSDNL